MKKNNVNTNTKEEKGEGTEKEKLEFFKREEIRTMEKDIARLREKESKEEQEKITQLKTFEEIEDTEAEKERRKKETEERTRLETEERKLKFIEERKKKILETLEKRKMQRMVEEIRLKAKEREKLLRAKTEEEVRSKKEEEKRKQEELKRLREKEEIERKEEMRKLEEEKKQAEEEKKEMEKIEKMAAGIKEKAREREIREAAEVSSLPPEKIILVPKPPSFFEKFFIRLTVILFLLSLMAIIATFWYWQLSKSMPEGLRLKLPVEFHFKLPFQLKLPFISPPAEEKPAETPPKVEKPPEAEKPPAQPEKPALFIPTALIPVDATSTLEISNYEELSNELVQFLTQKTLEKEKFTRLLIINARENNAMGLREFFNGLKIKTPENLYEKLNNDFTLLAYPVSKRNQLAFITKIKDYTPSTQKGLTDLLRAWEPTIEKDFETFGLVLGKEKPAYYPYFLERIYKGATFRYITFSPAPDFFGICYGTLKDYFIFSTSCSSTLKLIDILLLISS